MKASEIFEPGVEPVGSADTWEERFERLFHGELNCVDDTGGFDAKPYVKKFIEQELLAERQKVLEEVKDKVINCKLYAGDGDPEVDEEIPDDIQTAFIRQEQLKALSLLEKGKDD